MKGSAGRGAGKGPRGISWVCSNNKQMLQSIVDPHAQRSATPKPFQSSENSMLSGVYPLPTNTPAGIMVCTCTSTPPCQRKTRRTTATHIWTCEPHRLRTTGVSFHFGLEGSKYGAPHYTVARLFLLCFGFSALLLLPVLLHRVKFCFGNSEYS